MTFAYRLQNSPLTSWIWRCWQNKEVHIFLEWIHYSHSIYIRQKKEDEKVEKTECRKCRKSKELNRLTVVKDENGTVKLMCIECQTGSKELEDLHVKLENEMFAAADKIWNRILGV